MGGRSGGRRIRTQEGLDGATLSGDPRRRTAFPRGSRFERLVARWGRWDRRRPSAPGDLSEGQDAGEAAPYTRSKPFLPGLEATRYLACRAGAAAGGDGEPLPAAFPLTRSRGWPGGRSPGHPLPARNDQGEEPMEIHTIGRVLDQWSAGSVPGYTGWEWSGLSGAEETQH
jgi:hypothetical protein